MPQPITHGLIAKAACKNVLPSLWQNHGRIIQFGCFGPDLFYLTCGEVSNKIHLDKSFTCFCHMMEKLKECTLSTEKCQEIKAYIYGWYSHIIVDCIFHPFVYRKSQDHWLNHPFADYIAHKYWETYIDKYFFQQSINADELCCKYLLIDHLDIDLFAFIRDSLVSIYCIDRDCELAFWKSMKNYSIADKYHPLHKALEMYIRIIPLMYEGHHALTYINNGNPESQLFPFDENLRELYNKQSNGPWYHTKSNSVLTLSLNTLYQAAVSATSKFLFLSEHFLASDITEPSQYFKSELPYLECNYNLDTGLPSFLNSNIRNLSKSNNVRFDFEVDTLIRNYQRILEDPYYTP